MKEVFNKRTVIIIGLIIMAIAPLIILNKVQLQPIPISDEGAVTFDEPVKALFQFPGAFGSSYTRVFGKSLLNNQIEKNSVPVTTLPLRNSFLNHDSNKNPLFVFEDSRAPAVGFISRENGAWKEEGIFIANTNNLYSNPHIFEINKKPVIYFLANDNSVPNNPSLLIKAEKASRGNGNCGSFFEWICTTLFSYTPTNLNSTLINMVADYDYSSNSLHILLKFSETSSSGIKTDRLEYLNFNSNDQLIEQSVIYSQTYSNSPAFEGIRYFDLHFNPTKGKPVITFMEKTFVDTIYYSEKINTGNRCLNSRLWDCFTVDSQVNSNYRGLRISSNKNGEDLIFLADYSSSKLRFSHTNNYNFNIEDLKDVGYYSSYDIDRGENGNLIILYKTPSPPGGNFDFSFAEFVGSNGNNCLSLEWNCKKIDGSIPPTYGIFHPKISVI